MNLLLIFGLAVAKNTPYNRPTCRPPRTRFKEHDLEILYKSKFAYHLVEVIHRKTGIDFNILNILKKGIKINNRTVLGL